MTISIKALAARISARASAMDGAGEGWAPAAFNEAIKNCGNGAGGFQPGNTCARGGGGGEESGSTPGGAPSVTKVDVPDDPKADMSHFEMTATSEAGYKLEVTNKTFESGAERGWVTVKDSKGKKVLDTALQSMFHYNTESKRFDKGNFKPLSAEERARGAEALGRAMVQSGHSGVVLGGSGAKWVSKREITPKDVVNHYNLQQYGFGSKAKKSWAEHAFDLALGEERED